MELYATIGAIVAAIALQVLVTQLHARRRVNEGALTTNNSFTLPYFGNLLQLLFFSESFLQRIRDSRLREAFPLYLFSRTFIVIYDPPVADALADVKQSLSKDPSTLQILENAFSLPPQGPALDAALQLCLAPLSLDVQSSISQSAVKQFQAHLPDLISFMSTLVDQAPWERDTVTSVTEDYSTATVSFYELFRNFTSHHLVSTLLPSHLLESHPHAQSLTLDLWNTDAATFPLALGLPRWLPLPRLTTAHIARRNLLWTLGGLLRGLDQLDGGHEPGGEWQNLGVEDVSPFLRDFQASCRAASPDARASLLLARTLALCARVTKLAFWMLSHLYADARLLAELRDEIEEAASAVQPPPNFGVTEPVRLSIDTTGLGKCEALNGAYLETKRLYERSFSLVKADENCTITPKGAHADQLSLKKGSFVVTAPWLHNTNPANFVQPRKWEADRHTEAGGWEDDVLMASQGIDIDLAGGEGLIKELTLALVAGLVAIWDIEMLPKMPKPARSVSVAGPRAFPNAKLKRREI